MYYEEKIVDGILCYRGTPDGEWIPFTLEELSRAYVVLQYRLSQMGEFK